MIEELRDIAFYITIKDVLGRLLIALLCGIIISCIYKITYKGRVISTTFANSIILLTMITAVVIMVIGNNLAAAFGLAGAMSIIRFRTAVKDTQDIMFIFFALSIGLACGVNLISVAVVGTLIIGAVIILVVKLNSSEKKEKYFFLQLVYTGSESNSKSLDPVIDKFCTRHKVINIKSGGDESNKVLEVSYYIKFRNEDNSQKFISEVKNLKGITSANLISEEDKQRE